MWVLNGRFGMQVTNVRKLCQGISFAGPAICMLLLAYLSPNTGGTVTAGLQSLIVGIMSIAFALGAWSRAGLYCAHQDMSPKCVFTLDHATRRCRLGRIAETGFAVCCVPTLPLLRTDRARLLWTLAALICRGVCMEDTAWNSAHTPGTLAVMSAKPPSRGMPC